MDTTGRIAVFALGTDNAVGTRAQITAGTDNYSDWTTIEGNGTSDLAVVQTYPQQHYPFSTAYLFMRGPDNALWYNSTSDASGRWRQWASLGGDLTSAPGAGVNPNNQTTVFVRGSDNARIELVRSRTPFVDQGKLGLAEGGGESERLHLRCGAACHFRYADWVDCHDAGMSFLLADLDLANTFLDIAHTAIQEDQQARNIANARKAHDSVKRFAARLKEPDRSRVERGLTDIAKRLANIE